MSSDHAKNIESKTIKEFCKIVKLMKTRMTSYHPEGSVEGFKQTLIKLFNENSMCHLKFMLLTLSRTMLLDIQPSPYA